MSEWEDCVCGECDYAEWEDCVCSECDYVAEYSDTAYAAEYSDTAYDRIKYLRCRRMPPTALNDGSANYPTVGVNRSACAEFKEKKNTLQT